MSKYQKKIPNYLTLLRVALIPFLIIAFYFENGIKYISSAIFIVASITDYFDGYLSRKWQVESRLGALMDPIADKLIVTTALAIIIATESTHLVPAVGIMCREIFVSGLREFTATEEVSLPVTKLAKWKTGLQMLSITLLLAASGEVGSIVFYTGSILLWLAFLVTIYTGFIYFRAVQKQKLF